MKARLKSIIS